MVHVVKNVLTGLLLRIRVQIQQAINPIEAKLPDETDLIAVIGNCRIPEAPFEKIYRACFQISRNRMAACMIETLNKEPIASRQTALCKVALDRPKAYPASLWVGKTLDLVEGRRRVGQMEIKEMLNPVLDRNRKFEDKPDILLEYALLNRALKLSLEFGKEMSKSLHDKIMQFIPQLSGRDIDKIAEYVIGVRDDVIWRIYYDHYDAKSESFSIDVKAEATRKYPWINEGNLISLDSQGRYYSWHG